MIACLRSIGPTVAVLSLAALAGEVKLTESQMPKPALDAVHRKYPAAKVLGFEKETEDGKTIFEVKLTVGTERVDVGLSAEGKILAEETVITADALPAEVKSGLARSPYAKWSVTKVEKIIENEDSSKPTYEVQLKSGPARTEVVLDAAGKIVKEEKQHAKK